MLRPLQTMFNPGDFPDLLGGLESPDDAATYRLDEDRVMIVTNDFFTPVVDDPFDYGYIAATNSLSDVYAMGGKPILALSIVALPPSLPPDMLTAVMEGLGSAVKEAGAVIAGGHSVKDNEPKLGLCVIGMAHPKQLLTKAGAKAGDQLILTKPLGNGIIATAGKVDRVNAQHLNEAIDWMKRLNKSAAEVATRFHLKAATDITGFGLLGHSWEMAAGAKLGMRFFMDSIPLLEGVREYAEAKLFPGGGKANLGTYQTHVQFASDISDDERMILTDPQTSGGLLLAVPEEAVESLQAELNFVGQTSWRIGEVTNGDKIFVER